MPQPDFALSADLIHLNHAAVGPWPRVAVAAVQAFAAENGATGSQGYARWLATETRLRERIADLLGAAAPTDVALLKNTSEALSVIAHGLPWQAGDNVVGIAAEFPSNRIPWQSLADRGVTWRGLALTEDSDPETALLALCDQRTRLIAVSWVQYASGLRLDLARLGAACRQRGILLCVDAIQGLGALPFDLRRMPADFVVADGHKWLLGPEGLALFWCRPALREQLRLHQFGWHMVAELGDYDRPDWTPAPDARRFECGSPNLLAAHALEASIGLLQQHGLPAIEQAIAGLVGRLLERIDQHGLELLTPRAPERRAGILTFRVPGVTPATLVQGLQARGVLCAARGGGVRFSPHFHNTPEQIDRAVDLTLALARETVG